MQLTILATNWGFTGNTDAFCAAAKKAGYDGIEVWWPTGEKEQQELFAALKKHGLDVGFLCGGWQQEVEVHLQTFTQNLQAAATNTYQKPLYINCHSGKDYFSTADGLRFLDAGLRISEQAGVPVYHETHRGRLMYSAPITANYLTQRDKLMLTADLSHWCNVHESLLQDQPETMKLVLSRTGHIHARIGHAEGPQVNDPRAPEWKDALNAHLTWWDAIVANKLKHGETLITFLTEFGPPAYLPTLPYTQQPVANQWEINVHMMQLLRARYANK